jgi:hypothetical protein
MKRIVFWGLMLIPFIISAQNSPSLVDIPTNVFINNAKEDIEDILIADDNIKKEVMHLFENQFLYHELTESTSSFERYWEAFKSNWHKVKFRKNDTPLLLFMGLSSFSDEREFLEIYDPSNLESPKLYAEAGRLIAYKTHPRTKELILFSHKYPCCKSASHNIYTIRYLSGKIISKDRFFVGRDSGDMAGDFFPDSVTHNANYHKLEERKLLRWSPSIITTNAFLQRAETNAIIYYEKGAIYKRLIELDGWTYVIMFSGIAQEKSSVINYMNFKNKGVYGWLKQ